MKKFAVRAMFGLWIAAAPLGIVGCDEPKPEPPKTTPAPTPPPDIKKPEEPKKA